LANGFLPQFAAVVGAIGVHHISFKKLGKKGRYVAAWAPQGQDREHVRQLCRNRITP
jgi:hypothetical protein